MGRGHRDRFRWDRPPRRRDQQYRVAGLPATHVGRLAEDGLDWNHARTYRRPDREQYFALWDGWRGLCGRAGVLLSKRRAGRGPDQYFCVGFDDAVWLDGRRRSRGGIRPMVG